MKISFATLCRRRSQANHGLVSECYGCCSVSESEVKPWGGAASGLGTHPPARARRRHSVQTERR